MVHYITRYLEEEIIRLSRAYPVVLLIGARQVGKTTLLEHVSLQKKGTKFRYVSLDEFEFRTLAKRDPRLFLEQYPPPLIIDEIQYAPELLPYIKADADRKKRMGMFWLTGSQQLHLMKNISETLAGRVGIVRMLGFSWAEERGLSRKGAPWHPPSQLPSQKDVTVISLEAIFRMIVRGSFPRLLHRAAPPLDSFYGSYVQTYIDRDLRDLARVTALANFERFVRVCASRTASVLNLSDLARDSDVSVNTAKEWLSILEASNQVYLLRPYYVNIAKRLIKAPKLYFFDTGLVSYLTGWRDHKVAMRGASAGALFETFVVGELLKSYYHRGKEPRFYYLRTKEKYEVDVVIERNGVLHPVEVKLSAIVRKEDLKGIQYLQRTKMKLGPGAVIAPIRRPYTIQKNLIALPPTAII